MRANGIGSLILFKLLLVVVGLQWGCATAQKNATHHKRLHLDDQERVDYLYTQAEAYSQSNQPKKSIPLFKEATLITPQSSALQLRLALELLQVDEWSESLQITNQVMEKEPENTRAMALQAQILVQIKNDQEAINLYQKLVKKDPQMFEAFINLGVLYAQRGEWSKAEALFLELSKNSNYQNPEKAFYYLAQAQQEQEGPAAKQRAIQSYQQALKLKPGFVDAVLSQAGLLFELKQLAKGQQLLEGWQESEGPHPSVAGVLADLYLSQKNYELAMRQFKFVGAGYPDSQELKFKMALLQIEAQKFAEATVILESILAELPDSDRARYILAAVYLEMNESEKAYLQFKQVPYYSSYFIDACVGVAQLAKTLNRSSEAATYLSNAIKQRDDEATLYILHTGLLEEQNKRDQAYSVIDLAYQKFSDNPSVLFYYAIALDQRSLKNEATEIMQKVLTLKPDHPLALNFIAYGYAEQNIRLDEALLLAQRALAKEPNNAFILDTLGWIYFQKGNYQEAIVWLEKAFEYGTNEPLILDHLGDAYIQVGLVQKALALFEVALENLSDPQQKQQMLTKIQDLREPTQKYPNRIPAATP